MDDIVKIVESLEKHEIKKTRGWISTSYDGTYGYFINSTNDFFTDKTCSFFIDKYYN